MDGWHCNSSDTAQDGTSFSIWERCQDDICTYLVEMGERILENHTNITKSLWKTVLRKIALL